MNSDSYPYLYEIATERSHLFRERTEIRVSSDQGSGISLDDSHPGRTLFSITQEHDRWLLTPADAEIPLSLSQKQVSTKSPLEHLSIIQAGECVLVFVEHADANTSSSYSANLWLISQLLDVPPQAVGPAEAKRTIQAGETMRVPFDQIRQMTGSVVPLDIPGAIPLPDKRAIIGRDSERSDICLPDVRVSRMHAAIERTGPYATITDLKSANHTFVNGERITAPTVITDGARVQIGPHTWIFRSHALYPLCRENNVELVARNLVRRVADRMNRGMEKVILDDVSLVVRPREFVCILGPSGSGKTTLLSALSARVPANQGQVLLNGENLYAHFDALKQNLAVVPQRDVMHDVLPLKTALWYTAKMRLPSDMSRRDIEARIDETLDTVSLVQRQFTQIRQLSGGQIKRASWANEAISNPSLIFLDEVTSGLDEQTDSEMMRMFRRMADEGKTLVCVTHSLSYVPDNCHLVAILAEGGVLAYFGPPETALEYFGIKRLGDVYQVLRQRTPGEWKDSFRNSAIYKEYVERRLPATTNSEAKPVQRRRGFQLKVMWRQFHVLLRRYLAIQWADKRALAMIFGQCLVIAGLLVWLFGDISNLNVDTEVTAREEQLYELQYGGSLSTMSSEDRAFLEADEEFIRQRDKQREELRVEAELAMRTDLSSKLLFLLCISCIWFGCNNSAKEIVKEATIYGKERDVGLRVLGYYSSKFVLLALVSILQVSLFYWIVNRFTHLGGDAIEQWLLLSLAATTGVAMGLAISALATTEDLAATVVPMVLIPQIILAGLIAPLQNYTREFSQLCIPTYWGFQGLLTTLENSVQARLRDAEYLTLSEAWSPAWGCVALAAYVLVFSGVALVALRVRD
ncbi:MAG: ATP-binding cassette domain-containing protein [Planctomycetaceae bacterium]|nr:ATP-binding cassette domain-containing protein [Planctomycetales bacterium]MCB9926792.1 ATP-binding cassette domain-containing protein [Planctomycetaceae bacterium]